jgi:hypothetical protein
VSPYCGGAILSLRQAAEAAAMYAAGPNAYLLPTNQLCQLQILTMNQLAERYLHVARYRVDLLVALCGHLGKERLERRLYKECSTAPRSGRWLSPGTVVPLGAGEMSKSSVG